MTGMACKAASGHRAFGTQNRLVAVGSAIGFDVLKPTVIVLHMSGGPVPPSISVSPVAS